MKKPGFHAEPGQVYFCTNDFNCLQKTIQILSFSEVDCLAKALTCLNHDNDIIYHGYIAELIGYLSVG